MNHWLINSLSDARTKALKLADEVEVYRGLTTNFIQHDYTLIYRTAEALEMAILDLILERINEDEEQLKELKSCSGHAFRLFRALPRPEDPMEDAIQLLRTCLLAVLGDKNSDAARLLRETRWPNLPFNSDNWGERTWATILDVWLRLIRKHGWTDRDMVLERICSLREAQVDFEKEYLTTQEPNEARLAALELICLYHLAKAAEILALYITDGVVEGNYQVQQLLDAQFDRAIAVCKNSQLFNLEPLTYLLAAGSAQMVENSIWTVTRAVNSRVTVFVRSLVDRGRGDKAIFDVLPPQRRTLAEKGLLGSSRRAVVVSLPTSSGKTLIAEFRILQALNQFDAERGWVAYIAPTKTLVNQIARQLRRDFAPLKIIVEQVSPALEIDNVEMALFQEQDREQEFRVLVTTPEKLDLMMRQGWEERIGRPLTLVIVDEAHNIQSSRRGLKLELLLATINKECQRAQFLLLTPFIANARQVARWLGGANSDDVSLALDWQPNDRVIGIVQANKGSALNGNSYDYNLQMEAVHTTRKTLSMDGLLELPKSEDIARTYSQVTNQAAMAAVTAQYLKHRGPVIVMHARPDWVWSLANKLKIHSNRAEKPTKRIKLVQDFLKLELGEKFPLIDLLYYKIGIHHGGLPDDVRSLMEWLFEESELDFLVATTTIAQGVNFPVTGVVMASHQYPEKNQTVDMPPEDFWNIAGRAGRIGQGSLGVVALVASNPDKASYLKTFVNKQSGDLDSALIELAQNAQTYLSDLGGIVYRYPEWSSFLQYLAHTYRQIGKPDAFVDQVEQILRGTLGFETLRQKEPALATKLLQGINGYTDYMNRPNQPLKLVDSTGFSLQSINTVLTKKGNIGTMSWDSTTLFSANDHTLRDMMGILLSVPELRQNLQDVTGGPTPDGEKLALIIKDWVNGETINVIANKYFRKDTDDETHALTKCGQNLFGRLTQTASWGLGALLSITGGDLPDEQYKAVNNLPSRVFYGVNNDNAISLRLLGIPRRAAVLMADEIIDVLNQPLPKVREHIKNLPETKWESMFGGESGKVYRNVWRVLEGFD